MDVTVCTCVLCACVVHMCVFMCDSHCVCVCVCLCVDVTSALPLPPPTGRPDELLPHSYQCSHTSGHPGQHASEQTRPRGGHWTKVDSIITPSNTEVSAFSSSHLQTTGE